MEDLKVVWQKKLKRITRKKVKVEKRVVRLNNELQHLLTMGMEQYNQHACSAVRLDCDLRPLVPDGFLKKYDQYLDTGKNLDKKDTFILLSHFQVMDGSQKAHDAFMQPCIVSKGWLDWLELHGIQEADIVWCQMYYGNGVFIPYEYLVKCICNRISEAVSVLTNHTHEYLETKAMYDSVLEEIRERESEVENCYAILRECGVPFDSNGEPLGVG